MLPAFQPHTLSRPVLVSVARFDALRDNYCAKWRLQWALLALPLGKLNMSAIAAAVPPAEELHRLMSNEETSPWDAAKHHPGVRHVADIDA